MMPLKFQVIVQTLAVPVFGFTAAQATEYPDSEVVVHRIAGPKIVELSTADRDALLAGPRSVMEEPSTTSMWPRIAGQGHRVNRGSGGHAVKKIIAILLFPIFAYAEPGPVTQYLINEPATLLDIGMVRLDNLTTWVEGNVGFGWTINGKLQLFSKEINSRYSPEDDKIYVSVAAEGDVTEAQMQEGCRMALAQLRIVLVKSLPGLFQHVGYRDPSEPTALPQTLYQMFELRCYVSSSEGTFWGSQSLEAQEMTIGKWETRN